MYADILSSAQDMYQRPSSEYQAIYDEIMGNLTTLADLAGGYQSQAQIMYDQLDALQSIEEILAYIAYDKSLAPFWWDYLPDISAEKTDSLSSSMDSLVTTNTATASTAPSNSVVFNININGSTSPEQTGELVIDKVKTFMRSSLGRRIVQNAAVGR